MIQLEGYSVKRNLELEDYDVSLSEGLSATADQTWLENPTSAISRLIELNQATATYEPGIVGDYKPEKAFLNWNTKEQADRKVEKAGLDLEFTEDGIAQEKLDILMARKREEEKRKSIMSRAPSGFLPGAAKIGTSLAVSIADPLNIASAFVPVVSQRNAVRLMSNMGKHGGRATVGAIEGVAGAAMIEPLVFYAMSEEQADYTLYDSYMNLVFGAVIGGGLHTGLGALGDAISKAPAQTKSDLLQSATGQAMDNKPIDVTRVADELDVTPQRITPIEANKALDAVDGDLAVVKARLGKDIDFLATDKINASNLKIKDGELTPSSKVVIDSDNNVIAGQDIAAKAQKENQEIEVVRPLNSAEREQQFIESKPLYQPQKHSNEADPLISKEYKAKLDSKSPETPETVDSEIGDIITSLDDQGLDTAPLKAEIDETNKQLERESKGLREAVACMLG